MFFIRIGPALRLPGDEVVVSRHRVFTLALLKKLAVPLGMLAFMGAATVSETGCNSTPDPTQTTSTSGTSGSSTSSGSGGAGGSAGSCTTVEQCPGTDTDCRARTCAAGVCGFTNAAAGKATASQTPGDCKASVCDGMGATTTQNDDADILDDSNDCTDDVCTAGAPTNTPKASGAVCASSGGKVCDGANTCVECVTAAGCPEGVCSANSCVPASCLDTVKNGAETDVDCGGADCNPCKAGQICAAGTDCLDTICTAGLCAAATCKDTAKNGAETDVDCGGGTCAACGPDLGCKVAADCVGGSCSGTTCLPTCTDKVKNTTETDVDCGGPTCDACADAKTCAVDADCKSKVCKGGTCAAPSCTDMVQNGTESDKDCGGLCAPCGPTQMCTKSADCATGVCTGNVCQGAICNDGVKNGAETDVDCGGMCTTKCATAKLCSVALDCVSQVCTGGHCAAAICGDGVKNGAEACDDSNPLSGDGCSSACAIEPGFTCVGTAPSVCTTTCGDGIRAGAEQCDDTNTATGDGCSSACAIEIGFTCAGMPSVCTTTCGDGFKAGAEACDDANGIPGDGCTGCVVDAGFTCVGSAPSVCTPICGDGVKTGGEACDDGNKADGDGCSSVCTVQSGYACAGSPSVCVTACGDGIQAGAELCDDNNLANGDCCSSTCQIEAGCEIEANGNTSTANNFTSIAIGNKVNGFIRPAADKDYFVFAVPASSIGTLTVTVIDNFLGITCASAALDTYMTLFDGAAVSLATNDDINGAANRCSTITKGGLTEGKYFIELRAFSSSAQFAYTLQSSIVLAICGNGVVESPEQCDGGAGCAADCTLIPICGNNLVSALEICDDGNTVNGDGCDSTCKLEGGQNEVEPNGTIALADARAIDATPTVITGSSLLLASIGQTGDKDVIKVTVANASVVRFETFDTAGLDCLTIATKLTLLSSTGTLIFTDTTTGIKSCSAIVAYLPAGTYYIQAEKAATGTITKYLLQATFEASGGSEIEPNGTQATATALPGNDVFIAGGHQMLGDFDYFAVTVPAGASIRAEVIEGNAEICDALDMDSYLTLFNAAATSLVTNEDGGRGYCSLIDGTGATPVDAGAHNLAAGTYYLQVKDSSLAIGTEGLFDYRLAVTVR
jgi:cysteine-rich repeat protein